MMTAETKAKRGPRQLAAGTKTLRIYLPEDLLSRLNEWRQLQGDKPTATATVRVAIAEFLKRQGA